MIAALASVWELLALQAPGSPLYLGMLPGPVTSLRELATMIGLLLFGAGALMPWAFGGRAAALGRAHAVGRHAARDRRPGVRGGRRACTESSSMTCAPTRCRCS